MRKTTVPHFLCFMKFLEPQNLAKMILLGCIKKFGKILNMS